MRYQYRVITTPNASKYKNLDSILPGGNIKWYKRCRGDSLAVFKDQITWSRQNNTHLAPLPHWCPYPNPWNLGIRPYLAKGIKVIVGIRVPDELIRNGRLTLGKDYKWRERGKGESVRWGLWLWKKGSEIEPGSLWRWKAGTSRQGHQEGNGKGKETDSPLRPPEWNAALTFTLTLATEIHIGLLTYRTGRW